jgi:putative chitinase
MITLEDLKKICPQAPAGRLAKFVDPLNEAMREFEISDNVEREAAFIAQCAHESGGFFYVREIASGEAYEGRGDLGNVEPDAIRIAAEHGSTPGRWWRGHGLIQITGYSNHRTCGEALGLDLLAAPELLETPVNACRSAAWFWETHGCNELADRGDFLRITKVINGGTNGWADRVAYLERAKEVLA